MLVQQCLDRLSLHIDDAQMHQAGCGQRDLDSALFVERIRVILIQAKAVRGRGCSDTIQCAVIVTAGAAVVAPVALRNVTG